MYKVSPSGTSTPCASVPGFVYGLTIDNNGNIYAANTGKGTINKIDVGGTVSTVLTGLNISGISISSSGNIYVVSSQNATTFKVTSGGAVSVVHQFVSGGPTDLVVDSNENLFFTLYSNKESSLVRYEPNGKISTLASPFDLPVGIAKDSSNSFYIVNNQPGSVSKVVAQ